MGESACVVYRRAESDQSDSRSNERFATDWLI